MLLWRGLRKVRQEDLAAHHVHLRLICHAAGLFGDLPEPKEPIYTGKDSTSAHTAKTSVPVAAGEMVAAPAAPSAAHVALDTTKVSSGGTLGEVTLHNGSRLGDVMTAAGGRVGELRIAAAAVAHRVSEAVTATGAMLGDIVTETGVKVAELRTAAGAKVGELELLVEGAGILAYDAGMRAEASVVAATAGLRFSNAHGAAAAPTAPAISS